MLLEDFQIEVPFQNRHQCWFCGEPSALHFLFPTQKEQILLCSHAKLAVPSCDECQKLASKSDAHSIFFVAQDVKSQLISIYKKHLAIGLNWTKEELENSDFRGGNFEGFQRSGWFMFEVAKARVNFIGWPIVLDGLPIETEENLTQFIFDGVEYPSINEAIEHYVLAYALDKNFFTSVLYLLGSEKFSQAVRIGRLYVGATPNERQEALKAMKVED